MENKKVLITNFEIRQFSGSEVNILSIAKCFEKIGYEVYIATLNFDSPLFDEIKNESYNFINITQNEFDFENIKFDIIWSQHSFLLDWLIFEKKLQADKVIISTLSPFEPFESVPDYSNDMNLILANSFETKEQLQKEGFNNIYLFENSAEKSFFNNTKSVKELKKIAIVSNHIPDEVMDAKKILEEKSYIVDIYGFAGKKVLINDKVLNEYDLVITIGKTVQYCMALKIPVYVYDRFGGPGYLNEENFDMNRKYNFSGRKFEKKSANELVNDIIQNFNCSLSNLDYIYNYALENFCLEKNFANVINMVLNDEKVVDLNNVYIRYKNLRYRIIYSRLYNYSFYKGYENGIKDEQKRNKSELDMYKSDNAILKAELKKVEKQNVEYVEQIRELEEKLQQIYNSKTWKYTNFLRKPNSDETM